jgi:hypothetical protein
MSGREYEYTGRSGYVQDAGQVSRVPPVEPHKGTVSKLSKTRGSEDRNTVSRQQGGKC